MSTSPAPEIDRFVPPYTPGTPVDAQALAAGARGYLSELRAHLAARHHAGASGQSVNEAHSDGLDRLIRRLHDVAGGQFYAEHGEGGGMAAIVAAGGYARRELSIGSDLDLLVLQGDEAPERAGFLAERLQYTLWDAGVEVGFAVRTVDESLSLAREDLSACTTILGGRFLGGDARLFHAFTTAKRRHLFDDPAAFAASLHAAMHARHEKFGESLYLLQPNVKESAGGLRDYHTAWWVARTVEPLVQSFDDFLHAGLLSELEMATYTAAVEFLWRVRNGLHLLAGRKSDQMSFELQEKLAADLGYGSGTEAGESGELPVEGFMGAYYRHARAIQNYSEIVIEQCVARARPPAPEPAAIEVEDGFRRVGDRLEIPHAAHLRERPLRLLTAFAVSQDEDVPLSRTARRLVRENLGLVDEAFQADPEAASVLLRILGARNRVMRTLMAMNDVGVLGRYLPEWEHIVCRWQHVIYHTYTVDVHSIFLVEALRRLWRGKYEDALPELTQLVRTVPDLPALFLGCLLHDIGKGFGGDHSNKGATIAVGLLERLGLSADRVERVVFIVKYHLLMSHVSQRRDLGDPKVIVDFARVVGDRENLHNLYLATYADMKASSQSAFSEWRAELLAELFERTSEFLESGSDEPDRALELIEARVELRRAQAQRELEEAGVDHSRIVSFFDMMPRRYFISHTPRQIARHAQVVFSLDPDQAYALAVREMRGDFSELILCTQDVHGLYGDVAGSLTASGINILGSHVYTTRTDLALEIYRVTTPSGGQEEKAATWAGFERLVAAVIGGEQEVHEAIVRAGARVGRPRPPRTTPGSVEVRNDVSDFYTVVDLSADDRLGLLYDIARTIADHGLEIYLSKATTVLDQVADTFYLKAADRQKLTDPAAVEALRMALQAVVDERAGGDAA